MIQTWILTLFCSRRNLQKRPEETSPAFTATLNSAPLRAGMTIMWYTSSKKSSTGYTGLSAAHIHRILMTSCCPTSKLEQKHTKAASNKKQPTISSSRQTNLPVSKRAGNAVEPTLSCHFCERDGFPNKKATYSDFIRSPWENLSPPSFHLALGSRRGHPIHVDLYVLNLCIQWRCDPCGISFPTGLSLRNHLAVRDSATKLSLPIPANKKARRKRGHNRSVIDIGEPSVLDDRNKILAEPVVQETLSLDNVVAEKETPGPLSHFIEMFDGLLGDHPSAECFASFE
ncbi:hypothetical protein CDAR_495171 [Caerostris darwini]|uniref:C2H2-type domain-containing protein n=1 Tax=Caerostris darwini TaxID=1538125 RepID=A0AAV4UXV2_9ARAC|nr:hypothetical protein CDAR_495171 [Caerostris darwini]